MTLSVCPGRFWRSRNAWWGASCCRCWRRSTTRNVRCWNSCGVPPRDWRRSSVTCTTSRAKSDHCSLADAQVDGKPARAHFVPFRQQTGFRWIPFALASADRFLAIVFSQCRGVWSLLCFRGGTVSPYIIWKVDVFMKLSKCVRLMYVGVHSQLAVIYILIYIYKSIYIYCCFVDLSCLMFCFVFCVFCVIQSLLLDKTVSGVVRAHSKLHLLFLFYNILQKVFLRHITDSIHYLHGHYHKLPLLFYLS